MRILIGGAGGLIGGTLTRRFSDAGHSIAHLVRGASPATGDTPRRVGAEAISWDPDRGLLEPTAIGGFDAVVHLGGVSIASGRWTAARKERILESRTRSTLLLAERIAALPVPKRPRVLVVASAVGYYGDRGDTLLTEQSPAGDGFLADVCRAWEAAASPAARAGVRVAHPRIGMVLSRGGGALASMLPPFRLGLGGPVGSGRQWWPWIGLHDLARIVERMTEDESLSGAVNAVSPEPVTSAAFARALGRAVRRPAVIPAPAFMLRMMLGEMADGLLLASARVVPQRLLDAGFAFEHPGLDRALAAAMAE
jgi:uncharacterized protein (TIGR01777 family)